MMTAVQKNPNKSLDSFDDALQLLDEALVTESAQPPSGEVEFGAEMKSFAYQAVDGLGIPGVDSAMVDQTIQRLSSMAITQLGDVQGIAKRVDRSVRENPWPWIAGAAVGTLALGYFIAQQKQKSASAAPSASEITMPPFESI